MMRSLWISKTGMEAQQTQLDTISNNLANVATNGFKRAHAVFEDLMYQNLRQAGANSTEQTQLPTGLQVGLGTRAWRPSRNFSQGNLQQTSNHARPRDQGNGFFQVQMPDGTTGYTRDGSFQVDAQRPARHQQRLPGAARHHHPGQRAERDDRRRRHGQRRRCRARPRRSRWASCSWPASSTRPAWSRKGQNLFAETAASGTPNAGAPGQQRPGRAAAGLRRDLATSTWSRNWWR